MKWRGAAIGGGATSGKLGPAVASRNKGGQYLRSRVVPSGATPTANQEVIRNAIRSVVPSWRSLTSAQRAGWNTYAANVPTVDVLGDTISLSGQNWFVGCNVLRQQAVLTNISNPPTTFDRGSSNFSNAAIVVGAASGTLTMGMTFATAGITTGDVLMIYDGRDYSAGRSKYFGSFQLATAEDAVPATASSLTFTTNFSHSALNAKAFNVVVLKADGRYSSPIRFTVAP